MKNIKNQQQFYSCKRITHRIVVSRPRLVCADCPLQVEGVWFVVKEGQPKCGGFPIPRVAYLVKWYSKIGIEVGFHVYPTCRASPLRIVCITVKQVLDLSFQHSHSLI